MNKVMFTGKIDSITDIKKNKYGQDTIRFTMEVDDESPKRTKSHPQFLLYGESAKDVYGKLKEGSLVYVEGIFHTSEYGYYITPTRIEKMLGNKTIPDVILRKE